MLQRKQCEEGGNKELFYWFKLIFVWIAESYISREKTIVRKLSYHCITLFSLVSFPELGLILLLISSYLSHTSLVLLIQADPDSSHQRLFFSEGDEAQAKEHNVLESASNLTVSISSVGSEELHWDGDKIESQRAQEPEQVSSD